MNETKLKKLNDAALVARECIIKMSSKGGCFVGSAFSCVDIIVYLYHYYLRIKKDGFDDPDRDYFILSKGHAVPSLYAVLSDIGWIPSSCLQDHCSTKSYIYLHPNNKVNGIDINTGSLGHGLAIGVGIALEMKRCDSANRVVVMVGDGELNEGSNWEALLVANALQLDNLLVIVDRNRRQANYYTEDLIPLDPLDKKFISFGLATEFMDGHDFKQIEQMLSKVPFESNKPSAIIANTVRGKGIPSLEDERDKWFIECQTKEIDKLLYELYNEYRGEK